MKCIAILVLLATLSIAYASTCTNDQLDNTWHEAATARWSSLTDEREFGRFRVQRLANNLPANTASGGGRGVAVFIASSVDVASAYVAVQKLRRVSSLRVEVFHGVNTMSDEATNEFESITDVKVVSLKQFSDQSRIASTVLQSSFMDVLVMDARTMLLADPIALFDSPQYRAKGLLMLPSIHKTSSENPIWQVIDQSCIDSFEQSAAAIVVNKVQAWNALQMAVQMRGHFFKSLTNGEQNIIRLAALATDTQFHMVDITPNHIASQYRIYGESKMCAHITVYKMDGVDMFAVSANPLVEESGASVDNVQCIDDVDAVVNEAMVTSHATLFASLPDSIGRAQLQAVCTAGVKSIAEGETLARTTFAGYKIDVSDMVTYGTKSVTIPYSLLVAQCASTWACVDSSYYQDTVDTAFINVTTGLFNSANIAISTLSSKNVMGGVGFGNATYIAVTNTAATRTGCDYAGIFDTSISSYNLAMGSWAVIRVAFDARRRHYLAPITLTVTYNGDSNAAFAKYSVVSPVVLAVVAIVMAMINRF